MRRELLLILALCATNAHAQVGSKLSGLRDTSLPGVPEVVGAAVIQPNRASEINAAPPASPPPPATGVPGNSVEYRTTTGGTYLPGYSPAGGGVVFGGVAVEPPRRAAIAPPPDFSLEQKITHVEALDGLTYANTGEIQSTIRRYQLVGAEKILPEAERVLLRRKIVDNPVATGTQNILSRFLRDAELIQSHHVVVGVVPRKNLILIGLRSSEEG